MHLYDYNPLLMTTPLRCSLINYDGGIHAMLSQYIRRAGCLEFVQATGTTGTSNEPGFSTDVDLIFLHLTSPDETVRSELALHLKHHRGVVVTSPFPRHQFNDLFTQPFAFLTEPFSFTQFTKCLDAYRQINR